MSSSTRTCLTQSGASCFLTFQKMICRGYLQDYAARLKQVVEGINNHHDVDARWRSFPTLRRAGHFKK